MNRITVQSVWRVSSDHLFLSIDIPADNRREIQIISTPPSQKTTYKARLRVTTPEIAKKAGIRSFVPVSPPAPLTIGSFTLRFFPEETGGFNVLINGGHLFYNGVPKEYESFSSPLTLLIPARKKPQKDDTDYLNTVDELHEITSVFLSGVHATTWLEMLRSFNKRVTILPDEEQLPLF